MNDPKTPSKRLMLKERLDSMKLTEGTAIDSYLQDVNSVAFQQHVRLGSIVDDEELVHRVLASLPRSRSTFRQVQERENTNS